MTHPKLTDFSPMAFAANPLDRMANNRQQSETIDGLRSLPTSRCVLFKGDKVLTAEGFPLIVPATQADSKLFLGVDQYGSGWFAAFTNDEHGLTDLRALALDGSTDPDTLGILAQARSLLHWHERHRFCANCGAPTALCDAGYRRHCDACSADHFPRTDPVIIVAVRHGRRLLLGRQASWTTGMFSTLAGFMEPGETIEDAARREVWEEAGIRLGAARIAYNQPWPFPASLMIGLIGDALTTDITVDLKEIETARWFSFEEVEQMNAGQHPDNLHTPPSIAIAHRLIVAAMRES